MDKAKEFIICAAIHVQDGNIYQHQPTNVKTGFVICGRRHNNCYTTLAILRGDNSGKLMVGREGQGFLTSKNRFVDRKEGFVIALGQQQLQMHYHSDEAPILISEDLY